MTAQPPKQEGDRLPSVGLGRGTGGVWRWVAPALSLDGAIVLAIFVIAIVLNSHLVTSMSLYFDEAMSIETARQSPDVLAGYLWGNQNQMILYYVVLSVWMHLLHAVGITESEVLLRLPSIVFAALAVVVLYLLGRRFWGRVAGLTAALLYLLSTEQIFHAQKARAYPLQLLLLMVSWYALLLILSGSDTRRRVWVTYVISTALAFYAQPYSALVVAAQVLTFTWYAATPGRKGEFARRALVPAFVAIGSVAVLVLPLAADFVLNGQPNEFVPIAHLTDIPNFFIRMQLGAPSRQYANAFAEALGVLAVLAVGVSVLWTVPETSAWLRRLQTTRRPLPQDANRPRTRVTYVPPSVRGTTAAMAYVMPTQQMTYVPPSARAAAMIAYVAPGATALVAWLVTPMALAFIATQPYLNLHLFYWRYLVVVIPPLCLLVGMGVSAIRFPVSHRMLALVPQCVLVVVLVAVALPETVRYYATAEISDFRTPAAWVDAHYATGDEIVCLPGRMCSVPLEYYLTTYPGPAHLTSSSPGAWLWLSQGQVRVDPKYVEAFVAQQPRVFFVEAFFGMSAKQKDQAQQELIWLNSNERLVAACTALTVSVRLYAMGPPTLDRATAAAPPC